MSPKLSQALRTGVLPAGVYLSPHHLASQDITKAIVQGVADSYDFMQENSSTLLTVMEGIEVPQGAPAYASEDGVIFANVLFSTVAFHNYDIGATQENPAPILQIWTRSHFSEAAMRALIYVAYTTGQIDTSHPRYSELAIIKDEVHHQYQKAKVFLSAETMAGREASQHAARDHYKASFTRREPAVVMSSINGTRPQGVYTLPEEEESAMATSHHFDEIHQLEDEAEALFQKEADKVHRANKRRVPIKVDANDAGQLPEKKRLQAQNYHQSIIDAFTASLKPQAVKDEELPSLEEDDAHPSNTDVLTRNNRTYKQENNMYPRQPMHQPRLVPIYDCIHRRNIIDVYGNEVMCEEQDAPRVPVRHSMDNRGQPMFYNEGIPVLSFEDRGTWYEWSLQAEEDFLRATQEAPRTASSPYGGYVPTRQPYTAKAATQPAPIRSAALERVYAKEQTEPTQTTASEPVIAPSPLQELPQVALHDGKVLPYFLKSKTNLRARKGESFEYTPSGVLEDMTVIIALDVEEGKVYEILVEKNKVDRNDHIPQGIVRLTLNEGTKADLNKSAAEHIEGKRTVSIGKDYSVDSVAELVQLISATDGNSTQQIHDTAFNVDIVGKALPVDLCIRIMDMINSNEVSDGVPKTLLGALMLLDETKDEYAAVHKYFDQMLTKWLIPVLNYRLSAPIEGAHIDSFYTDASDVVKYLGGKGMLEELTDLVMREFPRLIRLDVSEFVLGGDEVEDAGQTINITTNMINGYTMMVDEVDDIECGRLLYKNYRLLYKTLSGAFDALHKAKIDVPNIYLFTVGGQALTAWRVGDISAPLIYITKH